jgi:hypothetical protein
MVTKSLSSQISKNIVFEVDRLNCCHETRYLKFGTKLDFKKVFDLVCWESLLIIHHHEFASDSAFEWKTSCGLSEH